MAEEILPESPLPHLSVVEHRLEQRLAEAELEAAALVAAARRELDAVGSTVQALLHEERREFLRRTREEAECDADAIRRRSEQVACELRERIARAAGPWVDEVVANVLPGEGPP